MHQQLRQPLQIHLPRRKNAITHHAATSLPEDEKSHLKGWGEPSRDNLLLDNQLIKYSKFGQMDKARGIRMQILISLDFSTNLDCMIARIELENWTKFGCW